MKYSLTGFILLLLLISCNKPDLKGIYRIEHMSATTRSSGKNRDTSTVANIIRTLRLELEDHDNFHIYGGDKDVVGYWRKEEQNNKPVLLFQSGSYLVFARIEDNKIIFDKSTGLIDSSLSDVRFVKLKSKKP
jgi:hypothetical protein